MAGKNRKQYKIQKLLKNVPERLRNRYEIYRPIMAKKATMHELKTCYTYDELMALLDYMDIEDEINNIAMEKEE